MARPVEERSKRRRKQGFRTEDPTQSRRYEGQVLLLRCVAANDRVSVIRLKQVEHVRNERNVLAAVAGHPFITTMVASFQDRDSLYMLVCRTHASIAEQRLLTQPSLITAPAAKSSAIFVGPDASTSQRLNSTPPKSY